MSFFLELLFDVLGVITGLFPWLLLFLPIIIIISALSALVIFLINEDKRNIEARSLWKENNEYYEITHNELSDTKNDIGKWGEYLIYDQLRVLNGNRKFLFNLFIPDGDDKTTEIDVLLIHETGIYVLESKNYSGWIFGSENNINWTQCLRSGRQSKKVKFYNPIKQNEKHVRRLEELLSEKVRCPIYSFIVFSDRCQLIEIELSSNMHKVINRNELRNNIPVYSNNAILTENQINEIFQFLYPYSQVSDDVKEKHINDVKAIQNNKIEPSEPIKQIEIMKYYCPKCGSEMSLFSEEKNNEVLNQHWKCLNFKECGHCMYVTKKT